MEDLYVIHYSDENYLAHYGIPRRSGRYPWGSGERPYQALGSSGRKSKSLFKRKKEETKKVTKEETKEETVNHLMEKYRSDPEYKKQIDKYITNRYFERLLGVPAIGYVIGGSEETDNFYKDLLKYFGEEYFNDKVNGNNLLKKEIEHHLEDTYFPK